jgi:HAD superfamily hydrolase (TIGR01509 family)
VKAIVFDCDGVLADTERYGHLPAFNQTFEEFGLPIRWSPEEYGRLLSIGGGKERMASVLTDQVLEAAGLPSESEARASHIAAWHARKTAIYAEMVESKALAPRPGVRRVIEESLDDGWRLAVASTSAERSVQAILEMVAGPSAARFHAILAGDVVARKKPAPDIYQLAIERLELDQRDILVIEDSRNGLQAAEAAGLACVVTVNDYTRAEDFHEARLVVDSLGDPDGEATHVLADPAGIGPGAWVTLADLAACLASVA